MYSYIIASRDEMEEDPAGLMVAESRGPKEDHKKSGVALFCYFMLGAGVLGPWNAFITAVDYFAHVFGEEAHMGRLFTICYLPLCALLIGVFVYFGHEVISSKLRINFAFGGFTMIMILMPVLDATILESNKQKALACVLFLMLLLGVLDGISQGALFGEVAKMPPKFTHAVVGGTASSGLLMCLLRITTKAALPNTEEGLRTSAAVYFACGAVLCFSCLIAHAFILPRLAVVRFYEEKADAGNLLNPGRILEGEDQMMLSMESEPTEGNPQLVPALSDAFLDPGTPPTTYHTKSKAKDYLSLDVELHQRHKESMKMVFGRLWQLSFTLFLTYLVTLSIFPGVLAEDVSSQRLGDWYPLVLITVYNASDLLGKILPLGIAGPLRNHPYWVLTCSFLRILFWPGFLFAVVMQASPVVMAFLTAALGISNGFLTALSMTVGPSLLSPCDAELAENMLVLSLVAGLNAGAFAGWVWLLPWPQWLGLPQA